jgi:thiosulfate/3-mercaptopyruvate sulfurtransferase
MSALGPRPARPLISVPELAAALREAPGPAVLDVRWRLGGPPGAESYQAGHIPGAVFADLDRDLAGLPGGAGGRHPLPEAAAFQAAMRRAGISPDRPVVVYDDADSTAAARAWWTLRYFGHGDVRVLDGGYRAWTAAGEPVTAAAAAPAPGTFTAVPGGMPALDAAGAAGLARSGVLLDARVGERYRGEQEPVDPVAGHIPGSGVTAAHEVLALALAGIPAALYVGSWSGWVADASHAVATGAAPG